MAAASGSSEWYVRLLLTRGVGALSYDPGGCPEPTVVIIVLPHAEPPAELLSRASPSSARPSSATTRAPSTRASSPTTC